MKELIREYVDYLKIEKRFSQNTVLAYRRDVIRFFSYFDKFDIERLSAANIRSHFLDLRKKGQSARSIARYLASIKSFFRYLCHEGQITESPVEIIESPRLWKKLPEILSQKEVELLVVFPDLKELNSRVLCSDTNLLRIQF